jgi:hypothetical protein
MLVARTGHSFERPPRAMVDHSVIAGLEPHRQESRKMTRTGEEAKMEEENDNTTAASWRKLIWRTCPGTVQVHVQVQYCPGTVQVLSRCCPGAVQVLSWCCPGTVPVLSRYCPYIR